MLTLTNGTPLTATEAKMLSILSDGEPHSREEMFECIWDEQASIETIKFHICNLRKKLKRGLTILCQFYKRSMYYRLIKLVGEARRKSFLLETTA